MMVSLTHLSREERIGLGLAAAAHVALLVALVLHVRDEPTPLPIPDRMDVSLATEVSLASTAPDPSAEPQAAVAPVLAPEPAPQVEREPEPAPRPVVREQPRPEPQPARQVERPTPAPRPSASPRPAPTPTSRATPRPAPSPTARATPTPRATPTQAGGSRIGADFLEGSGGAERSDARGTPAATFGPAQQASLEQAINRQLKPHWSAPQGVDAERLVTVLTWELNADGSLRGAPRVVSQAGINDSNRPQAALHAERAIRAVQLAAPFDLPDQFFDKWRRIREWRFDRRL